jgi:tetratricopeptide (TPR) repeat protein
VSQGSANLSVRARRAAQSKDWRTVRDCAQRLLAAEPADAEGYFLLGLAEKAGNRPLVAASAFARALELDAERYDAAVELASQYTVARRNGEAAALLGRYEDRLANSPRYLDMAGTVYVDIGLPERALPLYRKATALQPEIDLFQANRASCSVYLGEIDEAEAIYRRLLQRKPAHQRNHYHLSRLKKARDRTHVEAMLRVLDASRLPPDGNVFIYYAIAKELEDLGEWDEAFRYYTLGGNAVSGVAGYDAGDDIDLLEKVIEVCNAAWLARGPAPSIGTKTPIFIVGLPRTGTTLTERILSSHSAVSSLGETLFLPMVLRRESGVESAERMTAAMLEAAADKPMAAIAKGYLEAVDYRLGPEPYFIDKYPESFLYLGFIARAFPNARIVHLRRHPLDACFAMYKQVFTWAYRFSYNLGDLGRYYVAYDRLLRHWRAVLGERLVEVEYESLVTSHEAETRSLLERLGLDFEPACLDFSANRAASTTASSVQVREKIHARSVAKWRRFAAHLEPLRAQLAAAGIEVANGAAAGDAA